MKKNHLLAVILVTALLLTAVIAGAPTAQAADAHTHCACGGKTCVGTAGGHVNNTARKWVEFTPEMATVGATSTGVRLVKNASETSLKITDYNDALYLTQDLDLTKLNGKNKNGTDWNLLIVGNNTATTTGWTTRICLNGHKLILGAGMIDVYTGNLEICDCVGGGEVVVGGYNNQGVLVENLATNYVSLFNVTLRQAANKAAVKYTVGTVNLYGGEIIGNAANTTTVELGTGTTFNMFGGTIRRSTTEKCTVTGAVVRVQKGATFNMAGGTIEGSNAKDGGAVFLASGAADSCATFNMSGDAAITGGTVVGQGGAFYMGTYSVLNMSGNASITGGTANNQGGNLYVAANASVTMTDNALLSGGKTPNDGGNIWMGNTSSVLTMSGNAKITAGEAKIGGGVYLKADPKTTFSDAVQIIDNVSGGNVYLQWVSGANLTGTGLTADAKIGFTSNLSKFAAASLITCDQALVNTALVSDDSQYDLYYNSGKALRTSMCPCGGKAEGVGDHVCAGAQSDWVVLTADRATVGKVTSNLRFAKNTATDVFVGTTAPNNAYMYLNSDLNVAELNKDQFPTRMDIITFASNTVHLDLNGYTLNIGDGSFLLATGLLDITDSSAAGTGKIISNGTVVKFRNGTEAHKAFNLYAGTLQGGSTADGAPVLLNEYGTFNQYGGTVTGMTTKRTVVEVGKESNACTYNMYGGTICRGITEKCTVTGADVRLMKGSTFNMAGGVIEGSKANDGGAVFLQSGSASARATFKMSGNSLVNGGTVGGQGGAFYMGTYSVLNMSDDAAVVGGSASNQGGNIFINANAEFTMTGNAKIMDGTCSGDNQNGGNIYMYGGKLTTTGGTISGGTGYNGGNLCIYPEKACTVDMNGTKLLDGVANNNGGNIYLQKSGSEATTVSFKNMTISGGKATSNSGGNVACYTGFGMTGGALFENCTITGGAAPYGSNVYVRRNGALTLKNCTVTGGNTNNIEVNRDNATLTALFVDGGTIGKTGDACGILNKNGKVVVSGSVAFANTTDLYMNTKSTEAYASADGVYDLTGLTSTGVKVDADVAGMFAVGTCKDKLTPVNSEYTVTTGSGNLYLTKANCVEIRNNKDLVIGTYGSIAEALDALGANQYIAVNCDIRENLTAGKTFYLDLAGHTVSGILDMGSFELRGMDSTTNGYVLGAGKLTAKVTGTVADHCKAANAKRYLATASDDGYTFDRFYVGITSVSMNPFTGEIGYKSAVGGNENVKAALADEDAFGFSVKLEGGEPVITALGKDEFVTGSAGNKKSLTIENQLEAVNEDPTLADLKVSATVFIKLASGETIESAEYAYSIVDMFKLVDGSFDSMSASAKASLKKLYDANTVMKDWDLPNIGGYKA